MAKSLQPDEDRHEKPMPQAALDFPEENAILSLVRLGMSLQEARDMGPDETERYLAIHNGWRNRDPETGAEMVRPGLRKAIQADFDKFGR